MKHPSIGGGFAAALIALFHASSAIASNGLYLPGYGLESVMMGGADVAVSRDAFAANNNPAGMTQITGSAMNGELAIWDWLESTHTDAQNFRKPSMATSLGSYANAAYVSHREGVPYAFGGALIVQGGVGWTFSGLNTMFGTRDDASSLFTIVKLAPSFAWKLNDQFSVGASVGLNYVSGTQELFPNTPAFPGFRFKDASGSNWSYKLGMQYHLTPDITIGATYGTQTSVPIKNGSLRINVPGTGVVRYDNAKLEGIRLPEEIAIGISFRPLPRWLVSVQDKWYNWSKALNTLRLTATNPRTPGAPSTQTITNSVDMLDQHVFSLGLAWDYDNGTTILAGYNYGKRPVDEQHISPIFQPIPVQHFMLGVNRRLDQEWEAGAGLEIMPLQSVTYTHPLFAGESTERHRGFMIHIGVGRRW